MSNTQAASETTPQTTGVPEIDLVCCWVCLDDEYEHDLAAHTDGLASSPGAHVGRFREFGELTFSIPMALRNLPWLRRVFIVTNGQRPPQSVLDEPKVTWIIHADIIPEQFLPTFNYHAIMPFLGRIPGLAEWFISTSDDFFVARPLEPQDFLGQSGKGVFMHTGHQLRVPDPANNWQHNLHHSDSALAEQFGHHDRRLFPHAPQIFRRDAWLASLERFSKDVELTARYKVRAPEGRIFRILHTYDYLYDCWGVADYKELIERSGKDVRLINSRDIRTVALHVLDEKLQNTLADIQNNPPTFFCLNDAIRANQFDAVRDTVVDTLKRLR